MVVARGSEASGCTCARFVLGTLVPEIEPSSGNVYDALRLVAQHIIENNASSLARTGTKCWTGVEAARERLGSERSHRLTQGSVFMTQPREIRCAIECCQGFFLPHLCPKA